MAILIARSRNSFLACACRKLRGWKQQSNVATRLVPDLSCSIRSGPSEYGMDHVEPPLSELLPDRECALANAERLQPTSQWPSQYRLESGYLYGVSASGLGIFSIVRASRITDS